jgi:hypothetical protein
MKSSNFNKKLRCTKLSSRGKVWGKRHLIPSTLYAHQTRPPEGFINILLNLIHSVVLARENTVSNRTSTYLILLENALSSGSLPQLRNAID